MNNKDVYNMAKEHLLDSMKKFIKEHPDFEIEIDGDVKKVKGQSAGKILNLHLEGRGKKQVNLGIAFTELIGNVANKTRGAVNEKTIGYQYTLDLTKIESFKSPKDVIHHYGTDWVFDSKGVIDLQENLKLVMGGYIRLNNEIKPVPPVKPSGAFKPKWMKGSGAFRDFSRTIISVAVFLNEFKNDLDFRKYLEKFKNDCDGDRGRMKDLFLDIDKFSKNIHGMGAALGPNILKEFGSDLVKSDLWLKRFMTNIDIGRYRNIKGDPLNLPISTCQKNYKDIDCFCDAMAFAHEGKLSAYKFDKIVFLLGSGKYYLMREDINNLNTDINIGSDAYKKFLVEFLNKKYGNMAKIHCEKRLNYLNSVFKKEDRADGHPSI